MGGRLSQLGLVALVTLLYSGRDARAFALCNGCPELFAGRPAAPAQKAAQPQHRSQSGRQHAHHAQLSWHERRKRPPTFTTAGRASFKAFAESTDILSSPQRLMATTPGDASATVDDQSPTPATDKFPPATPAARIDQLFNLLAVGPSDSSENVAARRDDVMAQLIMRWSPPANDRSVFRLQPAIAFAIGSLLTGSALALARLRRIGFTPPAAADRRHRSRAPSNRARRLKQLIHCKSHPLGQSARIQRGAA
jgi:hypothetical protein